MDEDGFSIWWKEIFSINHPKPDSGSLVYQVIVRSIFPFCHREEQSDVVIL